MGVKAHSWAFTKATNDTKTALEKASCDDFMSFIGENLFVSIIVSKIKGKIILERMEINV
ncbi:hypothetical protein J19TS1_09930 [Heyndrickxia oleronia]|nr:hypothetical protein J19TS1_09930 [Heyndrickxia oleronia]